MGAKFSSNFAHSKRAEALSWRLIPWNWKFNWRENWRNRRNNKQEKLFTNDANMVIDATMGKLDETKSPLPIISRQISERSTIDNYGLQALEKKAYEGALTKKCVRLQAQHDPDLDNLHKHGDFFKKINEIKLLQASFCNSTNPNPELYPRHWVQTSPLPSPERKFTELIPNRSQCKMKDGTFSVMQFNLLAEGLASGQKTMAPFRKNQLSSKHLGETMKNEYGGFTEIKHPDQCLAFTNRKWRLLESILCLPPALDADTDFSTTCDSKELDYSSFGPDILCVEEIDRFHGFFQPALSKFGYEGIFQPKPNAPGVKLGWYSDGCALFFKRDVFELISHEQKVYGSGTQVYIIATLRHLESGRIIVVGATHLKAGKLDSNERVRVIQAHELLDQIESAAIIASAMESVNAQNTQDDDDTSGTPIILVGDFNAEPYHSHSSGRNESNLQQLPCHMHKYASSSSSLSGTSLKSAYPYKDQSYTTWKTRGEKTAKRVIDYIFYDSVKNSPPSSKLSTISKQKKKFDCTHILSIPEDQDVEEGLYPGFRHPSDHINIAARFSIQG